MTDVEDRNIECKPATSLEIAEARRRLAVGDLVVGIQDYALQDAGHVVEVLDGGKVTVRYRSGETITCSKKKVRPVASEDVEQARAGNQPDYIPGLQIKDGVWRPVMTARQRDAAFAAWRKNPRQMRKFVRHHNHTCAYCKGKGSDLGGPDHYSWHVDHIIPVSLGGTNGKENLTLACATCNIRKGVKDAEEFRTKRGIETGEIVLDEDGWEIIG